MFELVAILRIHGLFNIMEKYNENEAYIYLMTYHIWCLESTPEIKYHFTIHSMH